MPDRIPRSTRSGVDFSMKCRYNEGKAKGVRKVMTFPDDKSVSVGEKNVSDWREIKRLAEEELAEMTDEELGALIEHCIGLAEELGL